VRAAPFSRLGGEVQIQLALAKAANRKDDECIKIFKDLESTHPIRAIKRQAADLKYIMEAPKLQLAEDEKISMPVMSHIRENKCAAAPAGMCVACTNRYSLLASLQVVHWFVLWQ
jgi:hypothetical protein